MTRRRPLVLVIDDEEAFADALAAGFEQEGFAVKIGHDRDDAVSLFDELRPDVVLLDVMLPGPSGVDICREIRSRAATPIIMLTARNSELDAVVALEAGADDYVVKPYRLRELVARVRAVLRRVDEERTPPPSDEVVEVGDIVLDVGRHEVTIRGQPVRLPLKEFELLRLLLANAGRVLSRARLISQVWGKNFVGDTKTLDVHIKRLRAKLEDDPKQPVLITTVRGVGYRFER